MMINVSDQVRVRRSVLLDVCNLSSSIRLEDLNEIWKSNHHCAEEALLIGYTNSHDCYTLLIDGVPIAMFGFVYHRPGLGAIWLLGSDRISEVKKTFIRLCKVYIGIMLEKCPELFNYVDADYLKSVRWLEKLGAKIYPAIPYGEERSPFHYFVFKKENYDV